VFTFSQKIQINRLDTLLKKAEETHTEALIIYQNNKPVVEKYFGNGKPDTKIETMSCTKSIVGLATACLLSDGLLDSLDTPVYVFYPEWNQGQKKNITIRHILTMTSGLQNIPNTTVEIYPSPDFVKLALAAELSEGPGEVFRYNNKSLNLMAGIIQQVTHKRMDLYIGERLFAPLDIKDYTWSLDNAGNPHVMSGCQMKPVDFLKIGQLLLNKGNFNGVQVIKEQYANDLIAPCRQYKGYGLLWWVDYEQTISVIDDEMIDGLKKAGLPNDFIEKASQMKGRYNSEEDYVSKIQAVFGNNPWQYLNETLAPKKLRLRKRDYAGNITYRADGYLGNYIIVSPATNIVAIRMISNESFQTEKDNFVNFEELVLNLTK
jgi:CubicO group peptidase (beta-lactamase class C family)